MIKVKRFLLVFTLIALGAVGECPALQENPYELHGEKNFYTDYEPVNTDGTINAVIEIGAGDNDKWEVRKDGIMRWDQENGRPRIVKYLGYPTNYGMVPKTVWGDGDPLDILVIGRQLKRGQVIRVRLVGVLKMKGEGARDDKLIAILPDTCFGSIKNMNEFDQTFPGASSIIETWFLNYKGPGKVQTEGFGSLEEAGLMLNDAIKGFTLSPAMPGPVAGAGNGNMGVHKKFMLEAVREAQKSLREGGIPEGSVLVKEGRIIGRGHNKRAQKDLYINSEIDCLENTGKLTEKDYEQCTLYTTLSPSDEAADTILAHKIPIVVIGENETFKGPEGYLKVKGVQLIDLDMKECKDMMKGFMKKHAVAWDDD
ncbi:MAG: inorganic diphosphatase [Candidatus Omnitrophica bacterium]|nr:inorganic diphosphatase [Candidatus Omnitrophota bacterium]